jgi:hypothetical protein
MLEPLGATEAITDGYCSTPELNLVERYFVEITRKRIRRGTFRYVSDSSPRSTTTSARPTQIRNPSPGPPKPTTVERL